MGESSAAKRPAEGFEPLDLPMLAWDSVRMFFLKAPWPVYQQTLAFSILTVLAYGVSVCALLRYFRGHQRSAWLFVLADSLALGLHAVLLYLCIEHGQDYAQNLSAPNLLSLLTWLMGLSLWWLAWRPAFWCLQLVVMSLAGLTSICLGFGPEAHWVQTSAHPGVLLHVLWAVLMVDVLSVAALLALMLAWQEQRIRIHALGGLDEHLPPLALIERHLLHWLWAGFALLTALLMAIAWQYRWLIWSVPTWRWMMLLAGLSWCVLALTLISRMAFGTRGRRMVLAALAGVLLLWVIYVGSVGMHGVIG